MYAVGLVICIIVILLTYQTNNREKSDMDVIRTYNTIHNEKRYMDWVSSVQNKQKRNILEIDPGLDEINNNTSTYAFKIDDYNKDEVKQALYKVYEMVILELRNRPNDPALLIAIDDLEQDIDFINPIKKQLTRS